MSTKKSANDPKKVLKETKSEKISNEENSVKELSSKSNKSNKPKEKELKKKSIPNDTEEEATNLDSCKTEVSKKDISKKKAKESNINSEKSSEEVSESENSSSKKTTNINKKEDNSSKDITTKDDLDKGSKSKKSERRTRNRTGYNVFMKEKMSEITGQDQKEKLKTISVLWNKLNEEDKQKYNTEALNHKKVDGKKNTNEKSKKKGKNISGYNLFIKDSINTVEADSQREKMAEVGKLWREASKDVKDDYNAKAKSIKAEFESQE